MTETDRVHLWLWEHRALFLLRQTTCREPVAQSRRSERCISAGTAALTHTHTRTRRSLSNTKSFSKYVSSVHRPCMTRYYFATVIQYVHNFIHCVLTNDNRFSKVLTDIHYRKFVKRSCINNPSKAFYVTALPYKILIVILVMSFDC